MPRKPPLQFVLASFCLFLIVGPAGCCYWAMEMPAVPASKLAQLRVGMSQEEVRQLLGSPSYDKGSQWIYRRITWAHLNVFFDASGQVRDFEHDF
jgi:hypothetical protein